MLRILRRNSIATITVLCDYPAKRTPPRTPCRKPHSHSTHTGQAVPRKSGTRPSCPSLLRRVSPADRIFHPSVLTFIFLWLILYHRLFSHSPSAQTAISSSGNTNNTIAQCGAKLFSSSVRMSNNCFITFTF